MNDFFQELKDKIKGEVLRDEYTLGMYSTDASIYQIKPKAVVFPKDEEDVKAAVKVGSENGITILPRGA